MEDQREQLLKAVEEETYLEEGQVDQLRALIQLTEKQVVLDTIDDLLQRLLIQRTENHLLILRKMQNALRLEVRKQDTEQESTVHASEDRASERLLQQI